MSDDITSRLDKIEADMRRIRAALDLLDLSDIILASLSVSLIKNEHPSAIQRLDELSKNHERLRKLLEDSTSG